MSDDNISNTQETELLRTVATASEIDEFAEDLGIVIPKALIASYKMYKSNYFFSSKEDFWGVVSNNEFVDLFDGKTSLLAFGHVGYGFNSYHFDLYYVNPAFAYKLEISIGGAFTDNEAAAKEINKALENLPKLIEKHQKTDGKHMTVVFDQGRKEVNPSTFNIETRKFVDAE